MSESNKIAKEVEADPAGSREEIVLLAPKGCIGVELGVATGAFSKSMLELDHLELLHSVDKWDDAGHSKLQYLTAMELLKEYPKSKVWRMTAQAFAETIPDDSLGFIYIDCYAHTGQDNGTVLSAIWPKLKKGGIFSGDDYDKKQWRPTYNVVNAFALKHGYTINVRAETQISGPRWHKYPNWWFRKS